jgi:hypothetical protein
MSSYVFAIVTVTILMSMWVGVMILSRKIQQESEMDDTQLNFGCQHCVDKNRCMSGH